MIKVADGETRVAEYKRLLTSEWTKDWADDVVTLLWSCIGVKEPAKRPELLHLLDPSANGVFPGDYFRSLLQRIGEAIKFIPAMDLPKLPLEYAPAKRLSRAPWQADRLATYLTLQAHTKVAGEIEFFRDVQALAFQAAIHFVLPAVCDKHPDEHSILLHAAVLFPLEYSASDPAHFFYLTSMLHGYLGNAEQRLRLLKASFRATGPEDHSFLTKAEEYWAELLDAKRYEEAERFLFSLHWSCLPTQKEEVGAMIVDALKVMLADKSSAS